MSSKSSVSRPRSVAPPNVQQLRQEIDKIQIQNADMRREIERGIERENALKLKIETLEDGPKTGDDKASQYVALRRELDELERIHNDGKKAHHTETEQLNIELDRAKKKANDYQSQLETRAEGSGAKIKDVHKSHLQAQSEITGLKTKLRIEQERASAPGTRPADVEQLRKTLSAAEMVKRDLLKERGSKSAALADAEKRLGSETRRREAAEAKVKELTSMSETNSKEHKSTRLRMTDLEQQLRQCKSQLETTQARVQQTQTSSGLLSANLELQLQQTQELLRQVTTAYGLLAQSTVPQEKFEEERQAGFRAQFRIARLERKLAEREKQAEELLWFIRQVTEEKDILSRCLASSDEAFRSLQAILSPDTSPVDGSSTLRLIVDALEIELEEKTFALSIVEAERDYWRESEHYRWIRLVDLVQEYSSLGSHAAALEASHGAVAERASSLEGESQVARVEADAIRQRSREAERQTARVQTRLEESEAEKEKLRARVGELENALREKVQTLDEALKNEQIKTRDLTRTVKEKIAAEKALIEDVEGLSAALSDAARYEDAYKQMHKEFEGIIMRNELAEQEADYLSKFNAEILGHNNLGQRIHYIDRIRRDLADARQKLLVSTQEREAIQQDNEVLRAELTAYKSYDPGVREKTGTHITRVARVPLGVKSTNGAPLSKTTAPGLGRSAPGRGSGNQEKGQHPLSLEDLEM